MYQTLRVPRTNPKILFYWRSWGQYHLARLSAMKQAGLDIVAWGLSEVETVYKWDNTQESEVRYLFHREISRTKLKDFPRTLLRFWKNLKHTNVDIAFAPSYSPWHSLAFTLAARLRRIPVVIMYEPHQHSVRRRHWRAVILKKILIKLYSAALVSGRRSQAHLESFGFLSNRIHTGYSCVDNDFFSAPLSADEIARTKALGIPPNSFLFAGRLMAKKDIPTLIKAFRNVCDKGGQSSLCLIGYGEDATHLKDFALAQGLTWSDRSQDQSYQLPTEHGVLFYGYRNSADLRLFYKQALAFVLPSKVEPWGLVINEAMAAGTPCIASSVTGVADDLVLDVRKCPPSEANGFVFAAEDSDELATHMLQIQNDPELRARLATNARTRIKAFSTQNFAATVARIAKSFSKPS